MGGCGEQAPPSPKQIIEQAGGLLQPLPGLYRSETRLTALDLPGASEADAKLLRGRMEVVQPQLREFCLSEQDAKGGFGPFLQQMQDGDCHVASFTVHKGKLRAELTCAPSGNVTAHIRMTGIAGESESRMTLSIRQQGPAIPGGRLLLDMEVHNTRAGSC